MSHTPRSKEQILQLRWSLGPQARTLRLLSPPGIEPATVPPDQRVMPISDTEPYEGFLVAHMNVTTWHREARALLERDAGIHPLALVTLLRAVLVERDREAILILEQQTGLSLLPFLGGAAEYVLSARWNLDGAIISYAGLVAPTGLCLTEEPSFLAPSGVRLADLRRLTRWMTVEAWGKEARLHLTDIREELPDDYEEMQRLLELVEGVLHGDRVATEALQQRTKVRLDFTSEWQDRVLPVLKCSLLQRPVGSEGGDPYGWLG